MQAHLELLPLADLWHPWVLSWILLVQAAYLLAVGPMRRGYRWGARTTARQQAWFSLGLWLVYLSEGTPLHVLAEHYLFSAHMVQHVILTLLVPPLVLLGTPGWMLRWAVRYRPVRSALRVLTHPLPALLLFNAIYSVWHLPGAYQAPLHYHWFHMVQHGVLVFTAFLMWMPILSPVPELPRLADLMQIFYVFLIGLSQIIVFGMITFADSVIYQFYADAPRVWAALTPEYDQQLAGIIMKLGGMTVFLWTWAVVFFRWAAREEGH